MYNYLFIKNETEYFNSFEPTGKPLILMLRGLSRSYKSWMGLQNNLSNDFDIICLDLPGVGLSKSEKPLYTIKDIAKEMNNVLGSLDITNKLYIVAPSICAMITLEIIQMYPINQIGGLVLLSPSHSGVNLKRITPKAIKILASAPLKKESNKINSMIEMMVGRDSKGNNIDDLPDNMKQKWIDYMKQDNNDLSLKGQFSQILAASTYFSKTGLEFIKLSQLPVKFLIGSDDAMIPVKHMEAVYLKLQNENSELIYLKNSGHDLVTTHKDELKEIITNFINDDKKFQPNKSVYSDQKKSTNNLFAILGIISLIFFFIIKRKK